MCCIFTCCGWMIDLIQRLWTFTMSCCISSAVCCALVTASMSGIAMGYNYSLAEYIDLKETNVSVYLKRGVFDDEIADDVDWRRSGHMPVQGHLKDSNLITGEPAGPDEMPMLRSGRRLDDSLVVSNDQHSFEGSLMKLTAKPPDGRRHETPEPVTSDAKLEEILVKYPMGSLDQMKAIHSLMNERKSANERHTTVSVSQTSESYEWDGRRVMHPGYMHPMDYRPVLSEFYSKLNPQRKAAAQVNMLDEGNREPANWIQPKQQAPESYRRTMDLVPNLPLTRPQPTRTSTEIWPTMPHRTSFSNGNANVDTLQRVMIGDKPGPDRFKSESDYEDQANRGLPIRKKRNRRDAIRGNFLSQEFQASSNNIYFSDVSETNGNKSTRSAFMIKLKSSINNVAEDSSSSKLNISPVMVGVTSPKMISRFVSLH